MHNTARPLVIRYGLAVLAAASVTALRLHAPYGRAEVPYLSFVVAVVLSAWYGGLGPGLLATALSGLAGAYYFTEPFHSFAIDAPADRFHLALFLVVGFLISTLCEAMHEARRGAEERRQETASQREWFRAMLRGIAEAVVVADGRGRITFLNPAAEALTGWPEAEATGKRLTEVLHLLPEPVRAGKGPVTRVGPDRDGQSFTRDAVLLTRQGRQVPIHASTAPLADADGSDPGSVTAFGDISGRKQSEQALRHSEERYRLLVATLTSVVWTADAAGAFASPQPSWQTYTGQSRDQYNGRGWLEAVHPDDRERFEALWARAVAGRAPFDAEGRLWHAGTGQYRRFEARAAPLLAADGAIREWVGTVTDVDERWRAEEALREAGRRKDEFLAMLGHELRNPLAPVRNALQVLEWTASDAPEAEAARAVMRRQVEQLGRLVDDLLDVSRIGRGKLQLQTAPLDLADAFADALETSRPLIDARGHELTVTLPPEPLRLEADRGRLAQVLANLLNNAAKYTEPGGKIGLSAERDGDRAVVRVCDTGIGIPAAILPRVFDLFTQADDALDRSQGGLGIGLTLVRRLVEMHGGSAAARSEGPGRGSEFVIHLPLQNVECRMVNDESADRPPPTAEAEHPADSSSPVPRPGRRVLVVDDNVDSAESLAVLMRLAGHEVRTAHDGPTALQAAGAFRPEVIVLDIGLPGLSGHEVARQLRDQSGNGLPLLIALTGFGQEEDRRRSLEAGFDFHLVKPVDPGALRELLDARAVPAGAVGHHSNPA